MRKHKGIDFYSNPKIYYEITKLQRENKKLIEENKKLKDKNELLDLIILRFIRKVIFDEES